MGTLHKRLASDRALSEQTCQTRLVTVVGESTGLELCISVLELLQWKDDIQDEAELLLPLSKVLQQLLSTTAQAKSDAASRHDAQSAMDTSDDDEQASDDDSGDDELAGQAAR